MAASMTPGTWSVDFVAGHERTGGAYTLLDVRLAAGLAVPPHVNRFEDVLVYVLDGSVELVVDGTSRTLGPGEQALAPRLIPRRLTAADEARLLLVATPAGLEQLREVANDRSISADDRAALLAVAGIGIVPAAW